MAKFSIAMLVVVAISAVKGNIVLIIRQYVLYMWPDNTHTYKHTWTYVHVHDIVAQVRMIRMNKHINIDTYIFKWKPYIDIVVIY